MTARDLASNRAEVLRVVNTGGLDFAAARLMLWAMDLTAAALPAEPASRPHRAHNPNVSYHVPITPLFVQGCVKNPSQLPENTWGAGEGYHLTLDAEEIRKARRADVGVSRGRQPAETQPYKMIQPRSGGTKMSATPSILSSPTPPSS